MRRAWLASALMAGLCAAGCDRSGDAIAPAPPEPSSASPTASVVGPALATPASRPTEVYLFVDGKTVKFPPAIATVLPTEPLELVLHTDDPPEALSAKYEGNRIYLPLKIGPIPLAELAGSEVPIRAASLDRRDTPDGIFLDGDRRHLQPYDVRIGFWANGKDSVMISISGHFVQFATRDEAPPKVVHLEGVFASELKGKK